MRFLPIHVADKSDAAIFVFLIGVVQALSFWLYAVLDLLFRSLVVLHSITHKFRLYRTPVFVVFGPVYKPIQHLAVVFFFWPKTPQSPCFAKKPRRTIGKLRPVSKLELSYKYVCGVPR